MDDYKPNSHRFKSEQTKEAAPERKKLEKVITGDAKTKKKSELHKITDVFVSEDAGNVKSYILSDVLVPAVKKLITDIVKDGIDMIFYGGTGYSRDRGPGSSSRTPYVSYNRFSDRRDDYRPYNDARPRGGYNYDDVILDNRGDAEIVLRQLDDLMTTYKVVRVADLYDLVGLPQNYTDNNYGWTNIRNASIERLRDGRYMLKMPRALPLD